MTGAGAGGGEELVRRAKTLLELGRFEEGSGLLRQALAADPTDAGTWCDLAQALVEAAQPGPGLEAARSAIALEPDLARAHRIAAWALLGLSRALDALPAAREAARLEPESYNLWVLTEAELRCGHKELAEEAARRALELAPDQAMSHVMMADVSAARRRWKESEVHARRALTIDPENTMAMQTLARAVSFRGRLWQAVQHQDRAARLEPGEPGARQQVASGLLILAGVSLFAAVMAFGFLVGVVADVRGETKPSGTTEAGVGLAVLSLGVVTAILAVRRLPPAAKAVVRHAPRLLLYPPSPVPTSWVAARAVALFFPAVFAAGGLAGMLSPELRAGTPVAAFVVQLLISLGICVVLGRAVLRGRRAQQSDPAAGGTGQRP